MSAFSIFRRKPKPEKENYSLNQRELAVDDSIFQITDKGTREDKIRLLKILKNRTKQLEGGLKE